MSNPETSNHLEALKELTLLKLTAEIKSYLESLASSKSGGVFQSYLKMLLEGNGWLVKTDEEESREEGLLLLSHPKDPDKINFIVKAKHYGDLLSFDETKLELLDFEAQSQSKYDCSFFEIFSIKGYEVDSYGLTRFNLSLKGWDDIQNLIEKFSLSDAKDPVNDLYPHNQETYTKIKNLFLKNKRVCTVQATGTGKSYLIAKYLSDNIEKKTAFIAPSHYILNQFKNKFHDVSVNSVFLTYASLLSYKPSDASNNRYQTIILDEFHRKGAEGWGSGVDRLLTNNPMANVLGVTATPVRYSDGNRDMCNELFYGNIANDISLPNAIARKLINPPKYVSSLYSVIEEKERVTEKVLSGRNTPKEKEELLSEIDRATLSWEKNQGVPEILKKHLMPEMSKFIIFCQNQNHMEDMELDVQKWFRKAFPQKKRQTYLVSSLENESDRNLERFKQAKDKSLYHLLFCIDMLNEGLHISDVEGVIFLRPTESPRIFYQQLGRCLESGAEHTALVFDFVNNFNAVHSCDFRQTLNDELEKENKIRQKIELEDSSISFDVIDETEDLHEILNSIEDRLMGSFEEGLEYLMEYKNATPPNRYVTKEGFNLGTWVTSRRTEYNMGILSQEKIDRLESVEGWIWSVRDENWDLALNHISIFSQKNGHCKIPNGYITECGYRLRDWVNYRRYDYSLGRITIEKISELENIKGWVWDPSSDNWKNALLHLEQYVLSHGDTKIPFDYVSSDGYSLGNWLGTVRKDFKKGILSKEKIKDIEALSHWALATFDNPWDIGLKHLHDYFATHGTARILTDHKTQDDFSLGSWVLGNRTKYRKGTLDVTQVKELEALEGWSWDPSVDQWNRNFQNLKTYVKQNGDAIVPSNYISCDGSKLGVFVSTCRASYKKGKLSDEKIKSLEGIQGWIWDILKTNWEKGLEYLKLYIAEHGDALVTAKYVTESGFKLGGWVANKRTDYRNRDLSDEQVLILGEIETWTWDLLQTNWEKGIKHLKSYIAENNNPLVPVNHVTESGFKLGSWVATKRSRYNKGHLSNDQVRTLEAIENWTWDPLKDNWDEGIKNLRLYITEHNNSFVPLRYVTESGFNLGSWVGTKRTRYRKGKLSDEQVLSLESIEAWTWELRRLV